MSAQKASSFRSSSYRRYQPTTSSRFPGYRQTASGAWVERDEWEPNEYLESQLSNND
jgi:hypothetical protein